MVATVRWNKSQHSRNGLELLEQWHHNIIRAERNGSECEKSMNIPLCAHTKGTLQWYFGSVQCCRYNANNRDEHPFCYRKETLRFADWISIGCCSRVSWLIFTALSTVIDLTDLPYFRPAIFALRPPLSSATSDCAQMIYGAQPVLFATRSDVAINIPLSRVTINLGALFSLARPQVAFEMGHFRGPLKLATGHAITANEGSLQIPKHLVKTRNGKRAFRGWIENKFLSKFLFPMQGNLFFQRKNSVLLTGCLYTRGALSGIPIVCTFLINRSSFRVASH